MEQLIQSTGCDFNRSKKTAQSSLFSMKTYYHVVLLFQSNNISNIIPGLKVAIFLLLHAIEDIFEDWSNEGFKFLISYQRPCHLKLLNNIVLLHTIVTIENINLRNFEI